MVCGAYFHESREKKKIMALAFQPDWAALPVYVGFPVYYVITHRKWGMEDSVMYAELRARSALFLPWFLRWIFWVFWSVMYPASGVGGYLLWHEADEFPTEHYYHAMLACYWFFIFLSFMWMSFYQDHDMRRVSLRGGMVAGISLTMTLLSCTVFVLSIIVEQLWPAIIFGVMTVWLVYASVMSVRLAMLLPFLPSVFGREQRWAMEDVMLANTEKGVNVNMPPSTSSDADAATQSAKHLIRDADLAHQLVGGGIQMQGNSTMVGKTVGGAVATKIDVASLSLPFISGNVQKKNK